MTPSPVTNGQTILGVLYGANSVDLLSSNAIYSRWLQKQILITDSSGTEYKPQGGYGPDRQWFRIPDTLKGTITVYAEDGVTPLARSTVLVSGGGSYQLILGGGHAVTVANGGSGSSGGSY